MNFRYVLQDSLESTNETSFECYVTLYKNLKHVRIKKIYLHKTYRFIEYKLQLRDALGINIDECVMFA